MADIQNSRQKQSLRSKEVSDQITHFRSEHKLLQDDVQALLINGFSDSFIIESLWKKHGNQYSIDNIESAILVGKTLTRTRE